LIPSAQYVHTVYYATKDPLQVIDSICSSNSNAQKVNIGTELVNMPDFLDAIYLKEDMSVVALGYLTNDATAPVYQEKLWSPLYVDHVDELLGSTLPGDWDKTVRGASEVLPIKNYLFRYDKGVFWLLPEGLRKSSLIRILLALIFGLDQKSLRKIKQLIRLLKGRQSAEKWRITQDVDVPVKTAKDIIKFVKEKGGVYPLWLCPAKHISGSHPQLFAIPEDSTIPYVLNIGIYGKLNSELQVTENTSQFNLELEQNLQKAGGVKALYAHIYYSKEQFWKIYDEAVYSLLRKKYFADVTFLDIYDKLKRSSVVKQ